MNEINSFQEIGKARALKNPVVLSFCPSMDLFAVASSKSSITVHRLNWQKLYTISEPSFEINSFAWTPSGRSLCVVGETGEILLWHTEIGLCRQRLVLAPSSGETSSITWSAKKTASSPYGSEDAKFFEDENLPLLQTPGSTDPLMFTKSRIDLRNFVLDVAVVAWHGRVELLAGGNFRVAVCETKGNVVRAWLTEDLGHLVYACHDNEQVSVNRAAVPLFISHSNEIAALACHDMNLSSLFVALQCSVETSQKTWRATLDIFNVNVNALRKRLEESGRSEDTSVAITDILLCGTRIPGTSLWLESDVGEKSAQKLSKSLQNCVSVLTEDVRGKLLELIERITFRLREVQLMVSNHERFDPLLGQKEDPYGNLCVLCESIYQYVKNLADLIEEKSKPFESYCNWLCRQQKLLQYEEAIAAVDDARKKDLEDVLNETRISEPFDELLVAEFAELSVSPFTDVVFERLSDMCTRASNMAQEERIRPLFEIDPSRSKELLRMPAEELGPLSFFSEEGIHKVAIQRGVDDIALLEWNDENLDAEPAVSVYEPPVGDVMSSDFYKGGDLVVLASDEETKSSSLSIVENGEEKKTRMLKKKTKTLSVSRARGLAAVFDGIRVHLFDLECDEEEEEEEGEGEGEGEREGEQEEEQEEDDGDDK